MDLSPTCRPVTFWHFAGSLLTGQAASLGAVWVTKRLLTREHPETQRAAATVAGITAFWLVAGTTWVLLSRRPD